MTFSMSYDFFRQCRKFSTLSEKSIVVKSHMTFCFFDYAFFDTRKTRQVATQIAQIRVKVALKMLPPPLKGVRGGGQVFLNIF